MLPKPCAIEVQHLVDIKLRDLTINLFWCIGQGLLLENYTASLKNIIKGNFRK